MSRKIFLFVLLSLLFISVARAEDESKGAEVRIKGKIMTIFYPVSKHQGRHSEIEYEAKFKRITFTTVASEDEKSFSYLDFKIDASSFETGDSETNEILKKFLDPDEYPDITFKSKGFLPVDNGFYVIGDLNLHGEKSEMGLEFEIDEDNESCFISKDSSVKHLLECREEERFSVVGIMTMEFTEVRLCVE